MSWRRVALALIVAAGAGLAFHAAARPAAHAAPAPPSLCTAGERVIYSCPFMFGTGSVCMGTDRLHYRFGHPGHVDTDIANKPDWSNVHVYQSYGRGGSEDRIRFTRDGAHYIIDAESPGTVKLPFSPMKPGSNLAVWRGDHPIGLMDCEGAWLGNLGRGMPRIRDHKGNGPLKEVYNFLDHPM